MVRRHEPLRADEVIRDVERSIGAWMGAVGQAERRLKRAVRLPITLKGRRRGDV